MEAEAKTDTGTESQPGRVERRVMRLAALQMLEDEALVQEACRAIFRSLENYRDSRLSTVAVGHGLVIKEEDGAPSAVIRFAPDIAVRLALTAMANRLHVPDA